MIKTLLILLISTPCYAVTPFMSIGAGRAESKVFHPAFIGNLEYGFIVNHSEISLQAFHVKQNIDNSDVRVPILQEGSLTIIPLTLNFRARIPFKGVNFRFGGGIGTVLTNHTLHPKIAHLHASNGHKFSQTIEPDLASLVSGGLEFPVSKISICTDITYLFYNANVETRFTRTLTELKSVTEISKNSIDLSTLIGTLSVRFKF